ncbi:hypothetical protein PIB30_077835 [Stylosanthes scabra]|uniref:Mei2-like C-terminal RNA recognition motif domain-containing protein n=1 Tax=Stylosanthes scabra TaxID=79078 RepID=A0ABU6QQT3_9FABA|nr:hypothetical protein [Stylosanthes scabra]
MVPNVPLNPEAPEFFPALYQIHLPITWPCPYATSTVPPPPLQPPYQQREYASLQPNCSLYLPTIPVPLHFPVATNTTLLLSSPQSDMFQPPEPSVLLDEELLVTDSPKQQNQQAFNYENGGLLMNIRVGPRRSYHHRYQQQQQAQKWRPKKVVKEEEKEEEEEEKQQENNNKVYGYGYGGNKNHHHQVKGRQDFRRTSEHHGFNTTFPKKKRGFFPISPVRENGSETTVMIKNIPSRYTRDDLVAFLDNHCMVENSKDDEGVEKTSDDVLAFDFVYLPIDFKKGFNKGYAFVNFTSPKATWKFHITASNKKWELYQSQKVRQVVAARIQGRENLEKRFQSMIFPCESKEVLPVSFSVPRDGMNRTGELKTFGVIMKRHHSSPNLIKV